MNNELDKVIIAFDGVWPDDRFQCMHEFLSKGVYSMNNYKNSSVCTKDQFTQRAKDLGFINGYRWGVEYATEGKRPDLADDVEIEGLTPCLWNKCAVSTMWWNMVRSFRITDQRYKPADTSYLKASTQAQSLTRSEEWLTHSDWFDYEMHKAVMYCCASAH